MTKYFVAILMVCGVALAPSARGASDTKSTTTAEKLPIPTADTEQHLDRAARDFRILTYQTFRTDRAEYDRRQAEAVKLEQAWETAGSDPEDKPKLIEWFEQATSRTSVAVNSQSALPSLPTFVAKPPKKKDVEADKKEIAETTGKKPAEAASTSHPAHWQLQPAAASTKVPTGKSQAAKSVVEAVKATILGAPTEKSRDANASQNPAAAGTLGAELNQALDTLSQKLAPPAQHNDR